MIVLFTDFGADDIYVAQDRMIYRRSSTSITTGTLSPACALAMYRAAGPTRGAGYPQRSSLTCTIPCSTRTGNVGTGSYAGGLRASPLMMENRAP